MNQKRRAFTRAALLMIIFFYMVLVYRDQRWYFRQNLRAISPVIVAIRSSFLSLIDIPLRVSTQSKIKCWTSWATSSCAIGEEFSSLR